MKFKFIFDLFKKKGQECRDFAGDISNCARFVRCYNNLRVIFTCNSGTLYSPKTKNCVQKEFVNDCDDTNTRVGKNGLFSFDNLLFIKRINNPFIAIIVDTDVNATADEYPTIEAEGNALEILSERDIAGKELTANSHKTFGCGSYCKNHGQCVIAAQTVSCLCPTGYSGVQCQVARKIIV